MSIARRSATPWILLPLLVAALIGPVRWHSVARGADPSVSDAVLQERTLEDELARQRAQLADLQREQADLTLNLQGLAFEIGSIGLQIDAARQHFANLVGELTTTRDEVHRYEADISSLLASMNGVAAEIRISQDRLASRVALLQEHLRTAYEASRTSILEVLLSTDSFTTASTQLSAMLSLTDQDRSLAREILERRSALEQRTVTLGLGRESVSALRLLAAARANLLAEQEALLEEVRALLQVKLDAFASLSSARDRPSGATSANVDQRAAQIAAGQLLRDGQLALIDRVRRAAAALDLVYRGRFAWPLRGDFIVTQEFGLTTIAPFHPGLDMSYVAPRCSQPIYAAADGMVLADGRPLAQSGDSAIGVIIGHSQRMQTWYWHLSREIVRVGQRVRAGDIIGYTGMTGLATGCLLHFGVTFDNQAVNPRLYLP